MDVKLTYTRTTLQTNYQIATVGDGILAFKSGGVDRRMMMKIQ